MAEITIYKQTLIELQDREKELHENSLTSLKDFLDYLLPEGKGDVYMTKKKEAYELPCSHFNVQHVFYDRDNNICEVHIDNCAQSLPVVKLCTGDIIAMFNKIYQK